MNSDMLSKLVAALTPDSALHKALITPPIYGPGRAAREHMRRGHHVRAGYTKNHGQPVNKTRRRMAKASRRRNRRRQ